MRRIIGTVVVAGAVALGTAAPAFAHQHLNNPSGNCPSENSNVPQGLTNPAGNTPGGRNNAAGNERGTENCSNG